MSPDNDDIKKLDVRKIEEPPFDHIISSLEDLGEDETLVLINSFEPEPLYEVLENQGFTWETRKVEENKWEIFIEHS